MIGVDLGGTLLRAGLVKGKKVKNYIKVKTPKTKKKLVDEIFKVIRKAGEGKIKKIGIASPGPLKDGVITNPPNLPFKKLNLKKVIEKEFKCKVEVENDANCVALAESKLNKIRNLIVLTLGTGIGGGVIINNNLLKGEGYAGELGHIILDKNKYLEDLWKEVRRETVENFNTPLIIDLIKNKDKKSRELLNKISKYLGQGIASLINIFDPEEVVLSGGVKETGNKFLNKIKKEAKKNVIIPGKHKIRWTKLNHPGILGSSLLK
jgi:predicted NBD/HSP70 family sugar kinase